jgi:anti-sigma factor RsiW
MPDGTQSGMSCTQFDAWLSEALDGTLAGTQLEEFQAHRHTCPACGPLFAEAEAGLRWLEELPEAEPPRHLMHNILAATTGVASLQDAAAPAPASRLDRLRARLQPVLASFGRGLRSPRLVMSFGMAFFSISIGLNVAGINLGDVRYLDLRPSALQKEYYATTARLARYYENIRFV